VRRVRVTTGARRRDIRWKHRRFRIADAADSVRTVTARARRDVCIAGREQFAVHARGVFGRLIDALARRESMHELGVAVASRTSPDHGPTGRLALEPASDIVSGRLVRRG